MVKEHFLGLDLSTQSISAVILDENRSNVFQHSIRFDDDLPHYHTTGGSVESKEGIVCSPVKMWIEGMALLLDRMKQENIDFSSIKAISGSAQQHATVFWSADEFPHSVYNVFKDPSSVTNDIPGLSISFSPIWRDSSTVFECNQLSEKKPAIWWRQTTGSLPTERFSGEFCLLSVYKMFIYFYKQDLK